MPSSDCMILATILARRQVLRNRRQMPEITGKSALVHASDNHAVWMNKDANWENHRRVADAREIFGMLNIWTCRRFKILLCEKCFDWKLHRRSPAASERARYRAAGSSGRSYRSHINMIWHCFNKKSFFSVYLDTINGRKISRNLAGALVSVSPAVPQPGRKKKSHVRTPVLHVWCRALFPFHISRVFVVKCSLRAAC